jgi:hypothetical protein
MATPPETPDIHTLLLSVPAAPQDQSPLFTRLPAELRAEIFSLVLTDYPDPSPAAHYAADTCYARPSYFAPRRTDARLLRVCRAVYREACTFQIRVVDVPPVGCSGSPRSC